MAKHEPTRKSYDQVLNPNAGPSPELSPGERRVRRLKKCWNLLPNRLVYDGQLYLYYYYYSSLYGIDRARDGGVGG